MVAKTNLPKDIKEWVKQYDIILRWSPEDKGYGAVVTELPGCFSFGKTREAALKNAEVAIVLWLETAHESGDSIPKPLAIMPFKGVFTVRSDSHLHRELMLEAKEKQISFNKYVQDILYRRDALSL